MPSVLKIISFIVLIDVANALVYNDLCNATLIHSPFQPTPKHWSEITDQIIPPNMRCWKYTSCIYKMAPGTRHQQYAAVSFIMALLPLFIKDISWPHQRTAQIPDGLHWTTETVVRALGVVPMVKGTPSRPPPYGRAFGVWTSRFTLTALILLEATSLAGLTLLELYSKGSALKCTFPFFIILWQVFALILAMLEVVTSRGCSGKWKYFGWMRSSPKYDALQLDDGEDSDRTRVCDPYEVPAAEETWGSSLSGRYILLLDPSFT